jgi:hypothetical protein
MIGNPRWVPLVILDSTDYQSKISRPVALGTDIVDLGGPEFGDVEFLDMGVIHRKTRNLTLKSFRDSSWPKYYRIAVSFTNLTEATADAVLAFFQDRLGQSVKYTDHRGLRWVGIIITPTNKIVETGRDCMYNVSFELQGQRLI